MRRNTLAAIFLAAVTVLTLTSGCVSKATYQGMADQAKKLDTDLSELQSRHQDLQERQNTLRQEKADLEQAQAALLREKADLESARATLKADNAILARDKEAMAAGKRELEEILAAREDALSKKIAGLRLEMANHVEECTSQLADQGQRLGQCNQGLAGQTDQFTSCAKRLDEQTALLAAATAANQQLQRETQGLRAEKEAVAQQMTSTYQALIDQMKNEIDNGQITISELQGKLTVNMVDAILFDSGKAEVKAEGLQILQRVIDILKGVSDKSIRIEGHTDNVPIIGGLAQRYPSNWELAAARAVNVARFLQERGIDPRHLNVVAHGEYKPVADNASETGRARNRRIEIVLANQE